MKAEDKFHNTNREYASEDERPIQHSGIGPRTKDGNDFSPIKHSSRLCKRWCYSLHKSSETKLIRYNILNRLIFMANISIIIQSWIRKCINLQNLDKQ